MKNLQLKVLVAACIVVGALTISNEHPAFARMPVSNLEVMEAIKSAKVLKPGKKMSVHINKAEKTLTISSYQDPKIKDKDVKIDSVLICKSIIDVYPEVRSVRCIFYNPYDRNSYKHMTVGKDIIMAFGSGKLTDDQLMTSLTLINSKRSSRRRTPTSTVDNYKVIPGIMKYDREAVLGKIKKLKENGGDPTPFFKEFTDIEKNYIAKHNVKMAAASLTSLDGRLVSAIRQTHSAMQAAYDQQHRQRTQGPYANRRMQIMAKFKMAEEQGKDVSKLRSIYNDTVIPLLNKPGREASLERALKYLENQLRYAH